MKKFKSAIQAFMADEDGVTAIEYGLIASMIGVAMILAATAVGTGVNNAFVAVATALGVTP